MAEMKGRDYKRPGRVLPSLSSVPAGNRGRGGREDALRSDKKGRNSGNPQSVLSEHGFVECNSEGFSKIKAFMIYLI